MLHILHFPLDQAVGAELPSNPPSAAMRPTYPTMPFFRRLTLAVVLAAWVFSQARAAEVMHVRQNLSAQQNAEEFDYEAELLTLLLEKSKAKYGPYAMEAFSTKNMTQGRMFKELQEGRLDLVTAMTDTTREQIAIPIRYCLYKGLLGVRVGMGSKSTVEALDRIKTREELNQVEMGQVFDWPDYTIQSEAGLRVVRLPDFASGIYRLNKGTLPLMPLGIVEVAPIAKARGLSVISSWAIAYPTAYYIFVSKKRPELAERLQYGFELVIKDHSFDALFSKRIGGQLTEMGLEKRQLFHIPNTLLPKATPLDRKELWHPLVLNKLHD
jgi:hypothetical protein